MSGGADRFGHDDGDPSDGKGKRFKEFECPDCSAHNPYDDGFRIGGEVLCFYCGLNFKVVEKGNSFKLKET